MVDQAAYHDLPELRALKEDARRFVIEYVADPKRNGTQAALRAKITKSPKAAATRASEFVRNCEISEAIRALEARVRSEEDLLPRSVARLAQLAFEDRYLAPGDPLLPGLEDAFPVKVKHADSIAALKLLLQVCGVGEAETLDVRLGGDIGQRLIKARENTELPPA